MKLKLPLLFIAGLAFAAPRIAHADLGYWSAALVGTWEHPKTGDVYRFKSNATYEMTYAKPTKEAIKGSSGWWKIVQPTEKESGGSPEGPVALLVKQRKVNFQNSGDSRNMKKEYRLVINTVEASETRKTNRNLYWIDGVQWKRIK